jgi:hypothetical protein
MKKQIVSLNKAQLRSLIKEAIQTRAPGSPLFTPPEEVRESAQAGDELTTFLHSIEKQWNSQADNDDPSIEATGEPAWKDQVSRAIDELQDRIEAAIEDVDQKLTDGEFYYPRRGGF